MSKRERSKVAIACQGGGSHTAFTAGVLKHLLGNWNEEDELVGLSGTSGGAISALVAWYGLLTEGEERAIELLDGVWEDIAAMSSADRMVNDWAVWGSRLRTSGLAVPEVSPYHVPLASWGQRQLKRTLETHVDFDELESIVEPRSPQLVIGTVNVNAGVFETFVSEDITADAMLASGAIPHQFEAVEIDDHFHWDGLFSQNPPIHDLMTTSAERKPDELWVVQINPQASDDEPRELGGIYNRRNELSGNISLNQELRFIEQVNNWIDAGHLATDDFTRTTIHRIELDRGLDCSSKYDRRPSFIRELMEHGEQQAEAFCDRRYEGSRNP